MKFLDKNTLTELLNKSLQDSNLFKELKLDSQQLTIPPDFVEAIAAELATLLLNSEDNLIIPKAKTKEDPLVNKAVSLQEAIDFVHRHQSTYPKQSQLMRSWLDI